MHPALGIPPTISLPPGGGAPPALGGGVGVPGAPDSPKVADLIQQAADALGQAAQLEKDPEDKAMLSDLMARAHKFLGAQQKLKDQAMGAGPGAKFVRKSSSGGGGY